MVKFVEINVDAPVVEIKSNVKEVTLFKRKKMLRATVKKAIVPKNIVNATLMVSNVAKVATASTVKTVD